MTTGRARGASPRWPSRSRPATGGASRARVQQDAERACVYGDNAYGTGSFHDRLDQAGITDRCKTQTPTAAGGLFSKDRFDINLDAGAVTCPGGVTAPIRPARAGGGTAYFASACPECPLRAQCTTAAGGRTVVRWPVRADPDRRPRPPDRPGLGRRLPRHPTQGRTQARPPRAPPPRRTTSPGPRHRPRRRRLPAAGRRGQPRPAGRARAARNRPRMGGGGVTSINTPSRTRAPIPAHPDPTAPAAATTRVEPRPRPPRTVSGAP